MDGIESQEIREFLEREKKRQKENTYGNRRSGLRAFDEWLQKEGKDIEEINFIDIEDFTDWMTTEKGNNGGLSDRSAELYLQQVNALYKHKRRLELTEESENGRIKESDINTPVDNAKPNLNRKETEREKHDHGKRKGLSPDEMEQVVEEATSFKDQLVLKCLAGLGCRPSDLQDIRVKDVELEDNRVYIRSTKTSNSRRIPISSSLKQYLDLWLHHGYRDACYYADSTDWLIPGERSEKIGTKTIGDIVYRCAEKAGLQEEIYDSSDNRTHYKVVPYSFRIGYISYMKDKVSPKECQYLAGHKDIETTLKYYTEVTEEDLERIQGVVPEV